MSSTDTFVAAYITLADFAAAHFLLVDGESLSTENARMAAIHPRSTVQSWLSCNSGETGLASVVIPTFNRADLLHQTLHSVAAQSYRPLECIIVNDGSTDNTSDVLDWWIKKNGGTLKVRVLNQENRGATAARNHGTKYCLGEFIQYLDSDDILEPSKIERQVNFLQRHPETEVVFGDWVAGPNFEQAQKIKARADTDLIAQFLGDRPIVVFSPLFRRSALLQTGPWDESLGRNQEIDFQLRCVLAGCRFDYLPGATGFWRLHDGPRIGNTSGPLKTYGFLNNWRVILSENGGLFGKRRRSIANGMLNVARKLIDVDREAYRCILQEALNLDCKVIPSEPRRKFIIRLFGPERGLILLNWWHRVRT